MPPLRPTAQDLWRSLEQAAGDPQFLARAAQEFPGLTSALQTGADRRQVLRLMGATLLMAAMSGCDSRFGADLIPAVRIPPNIVPGRPNYYATAHVLGGYAFGIVVRHLMGRPVGIAGNPQHPASLGALEVFGQAQLLDFYDPDRAAELSVGGEPTDRPALQLALRAQRAQLGATRGAGLRVVTGTVTSPTLRARIEALLAQYPQARWAQWEPLARAAVRRGAVLAYGRPVELIAHLAAVDVLVSIDGDLLSTNPGRLRYARDFAGRRNPARGAMSRVWAIESTPTLLGAVADHRIVAGPARIQQIMVALAQELLGDAGAVRDPQPQRSAWLNALIADLRAARGRALLHVGADQPPELHALAHRINEALGGRGKTFDLIDEIAPPAVDPQAQSLEDLSADMQEGKVAHLLVLDSNPLYTAPAAWNFAQGLKRVPFSIALARNVDETAGATTWFVPRAHDWESWGDARAFDGSASILQPQALPLYGGMSAHELLGLYLEGEPSSAEQAVQATWHNSFGADFAAGWARALATGVVPGTASPALDIPLLPTSGIEPVPLGTQRLTVLFRADPSLWDGRHANNPWLQELPRPLTKLVWDNPLLIAPKLAHSMGVENGDLARLTVGATSVVTPVWILPGQAPDCVTAHIGSGRRAAGSVGNGHGVDFYPLTGAAGGPHGSSSADIVTLHKTGGRVQLASTEHHNLLLETPAEILRHGTLAQFSAEPRFAATAGAPPALYRQRPPGPAAWGMSVDLNACIGCNACTLACQAENNVSVVGRQEVLAEREMHWLRIDRYYSGAADAPESFFQPVMCMHCEEAPCELVCPVGATVHDAEGLNVMVYNRCVGTRFCSNNCPYKVRRFNFRGYAREQERPPQSWNPDVTVRARGVMEKCTYCLQRIAAARIEADRSGQPVVAPATACQEACPTRAISFGNLNDPESLVTQRKQSPLSYAMLESQGTRPRTTYEAAVRNPHPAVPPSLLDEPA